MYQGLASALMEAASWLQVTSQTVPISQLSLLTWVIFVVSCSFNDRNAFKVPEQLARRLSKASFQKASGDRFWR